MAITWSVELKLGNGGSIEEPASDEAAATARITALKNPSSSNDGWLDFADKSIRLDQIVSLGKRFRGKADE